jgi:hypothetical protein
MMLPRWRTIWAVWPWLSNMGLSEAEILTHVFDRRSSVSWTSWLGRPIWGVEVLGKVTPETPARAEPRPTRLILGVDVPRQGHPGKPRLGRSLALPELRPT